MNKFRSVNYGWSFCLEENNMFKLFRYLVNNYIEMSKDSDKWMSDSERDRQAMKEDYEKMKQDNERWFGKL